MNSPLVINGLPEKLKLDGWWLSSETTPPRRPKSDRKRIRISGRNRSARLLLLCLVTLADWLFWQQNAGASVAIFSTLLSIAMLLARRQKTTRNAWLAALGLSIATNLPVLEQLQPLSLMFSVLGVAAIASWLALDALGGWARILSIFLKITSLGPLRFFGAAWASLRGAQPQAALGQRAASWLLPLSLGIIFMGFFVSANPVFEQVAKALSEVELITVDTAIRALFWLMAAAFIWPYLNLPLFRVRQLKPPRAISAPQGLSMVVNAASVRSSLILFNSLFALQTGLDLLVLTGGMSLPEGMSYASYAHRGAYPLVGTALLSGAFAIGTRALIIEDRLLRGLVYVWLLQNLFLVLSAAFRLSLYVETYALTYLRVTAFIWMLLVFVGLVLVSVQISRNKTNFWLVSQNLAAALIVLYLSCFANFAASIAQYNVNHPLKDGRVDAGYICRLGPQALPVILAQGPQFCPPFTLPKFRPAKGWRDWGYRNARLAGYLAAEQHTEAR